ncbi:hypothetical protein SNE40_016436 [Patella caerulea]|uniref:Uncharacterized protein n=1 Tax=Patella caerulea TaxID=87958 RepID=A0AAN8J8M1_PATCE
MWVLPDGYLVKINTTKTDYGRYHFAKFGNLLDIEKLDDEDFGIYVCIVKSPDGSILAFKKGINVDGPYYGDLLEKYRSYAITGAIAASVMFVFASVFCFICHRQQAKGQDGMDEWRKAHPGKIWQSNEVEHVYDNKALESDVALEKRGTEMSEVVADYHLKEEKNGRPDLNTKL